MNLTRTNRTTRKLEETLRQALEESLRQDSHAPLMDFLHSTFSCDRVYLFERNAMGAYDATYEWTAEGIPHRKNTLQGLSRETVAPFYNRYITGPDRMFIIRDIEEIREADPDFYNLMAPQDVHASISGQLFAHDRDLGFFGFENPAREDIEYLLHLIRSIRNFLSVALLYAHTGEKVMNIGFFSHLTKIGDWQALYEYADNLDRTESVGVVFSNLIDLRRINAMKGRQAGDSLLIETGHIFTDVFDMDCVFRLSGDKHCAVVSGVSYKWLEKRLQMLVSIFRDRGIDIEIGSVWEPVWDGNPDDLIHRASLKMRDISDVDIENGVVPLEASAEAPLYRNDQFFQNAGEWLRSGGVGRVIVVTVQIRHYPLFSNLYDRDKGAYTRSIASVLQSKAGIYRGVAGTLGGGCFCIMVPLEGMTEEELLAEIRDGIRLLSIARGFSPAFGVYITDHQNESVTQMFDHSLRAIHRVPIHNEEPICILTDRKVAQTQATEELLQNPWQLLTAGEFRMVCQRIFNLKDRSVKSREAFARWEHDGDLYLPEVFLPSMRANESIYALDRTMFTLICEQLKSEGPDPIPISLNIEAVDLTIGDQVRHLAEQVHNCGLAPEHVGVEIDFRLCVRYYRETCRFADQLYDAGIALIIDDLGDYPIERDLLLRLRARQIKLSGHFARHICTSREDQEIVRRVAEMAQPLRIPVVAKHVETDDQAVMFRTLGCDRGQGFLFDRPMLPSFSTDRPGTEETL